MKNTTAVLSGFLTGAILGTSIGLLFAPKKGSKVRVMIADKARDLASTTGRTYDQAREMLGLNKKQKEAVNA